MEIEFIEKDGVFFMTIPDDEITMYQHALDFYYRLAEENCNEINNIITIDVNILKVTDMNHYILFTCTLENEKNQIQEKLEEEIKKQRKIDSFVNDLKKQNQNYTYDYIFNKSIILEKIENCLNQCMKNTDVTINSESIGKILNTCELIIDEYNKITTLYNFHEEFFNLYDALKKVGINTNYMPVYGSPCARSIEMKCFLLTNLADGINIKYNKKRLEKISSRSFKW